MRIRFPFRASHRVTTGLTLAAAVALTSALTGGCGESSPGLSPLIPAPPTAGLAVAGQVWAEGAPLPGATVQLEPVHGDLPATVLARLSQTHPTLAEPTDRPGANPAKTQQPQGTVTSEVRTSTTDRQGRFAFGDLADGQYLLTSTSRNHLAGSLRVAIQPLLQPDAAETTFVDIALVPTGTFSGQALLHTESNHAETVVYVDGTSIVGVTNSTGAYLLRDVPIGTRTVRALHPGYLSTFFTSALSAAGDSVALPAMTLRINSNIAPTATAIAPPSGTIFAAVQLSATASDVDGTIVRYQWDFEDDGIYDYSSPTTATANHLYTTQGARRARLRVTDDDGGVVYAVTPVVIYDAVYVTTTGSDANTGVKESPLATLEHALQLAEAIGLVGVRVAQGTYNESIVFREGVNVTGGHNPATWTRVAGNRSSFVTESTTALADALVELDVTGLEIRMTESDAAGTSIAMFVRNCSSDVQFHDCRFVAVAGASGSMGSSGAHGTTVPGAAGDDGQGFSGGGLGGSGGPSGNPSGSLGQGGRGGSCGGNGSPGTGGTGASGGPGGAGATTPATPQDGSPGQPGVAGTNGSNGAAVASHGSIQGLTWIGNRGNDGTAGTNSVGGGGGGGGGFQSITCSGGGGGGAGGVSIAGTAGTGGIAAGSSFAVVTQLSAGGQPVFDQCVFVAGNGGNGGHGGNGGNSAASVAGGPGGVGAAGLGHGGVGGSSGTSGYGGGGSGAPGGLSYLVYMTGSSQPSFAACTFNFGTGGVGGTGGLRGNGLGFIRAPNGPNGTAGATFDNVP